MRNNVKILYINLSLAEDSNEVESEAIYNASKTSAILQHIHFSIPNNLQLINIKTTAGTT